MMMAMTVVSREYMDVGWMDGKNVYTVSNL